MTDDKIAKDRESARQLAAELRASGKRVGFTSGVFDLLHPGHVAYLEAARARCDALVVAVNADVSVRKNKGDRRPIMNEKDRLHVVAGLAAVTHAFLFDDLNNNRNIEILKPDIYFKAGDYAKEKLTSAAIVESYGGRVEILPFVEGRSTTGLIETILERYGDEIPQCTALPPPERKPAVFVDRDGTINKHVEYLHEASQFELIPGALEALKRLRAAGFRIVVVTNQPGIGMGYFSKEDFFRVNRRMLQEAAALNLRFDKVYFCPHSEGEACTCRKPSTGMIDRAVRELNLDLGKSYMIGDTTMDVALGKNAGCKTILVQTGLAGGDKRFPAAADYTAADLTAAADLILAQGR